jgi:hypothetical protein
VLSAKAGSASGLGLPRLLRSAIFPLVSQEDQAPDFIVPNEFNPAVIIEAKLTEDDGTARDKVARVQNLRAIRDREGKNYEIVACIAGRGFKVRRADIRRLLEATDGKVFTLATMERLLDCTRIRDFVTRT